MWMTNGRYRATPIVVVFIVLLLGQSLTTVAPAVTAQTPTPKPNVVFILLDDLDATMLEDNLRYYPNMRALKEQGTSFSNAFVATPLCCPSRATILRGQYPHNHGVLQNRPPSGGFQTFYEEGRESSTVATWLEDASYQTALIGKYLNDYPKGVRPRHIPPGWNRWFANISGAYYRTVFNDDGRIVEHGKANEDYTTDILRQETIDLINIAAAADDPFFVYLAPNAPHAPATPARRHEDLLRNVEAPRSPSFDEANVSDKPPYIQAKPRLTRQQKSQIDTFYRQKLQTLLAIDEMVGAIVDALDSARALDETYIFLMSDNGFEAGEHRIPAEKGRPYDESTRTPLFIRGPNVPANLVVDRLVLSTDIAPTIADLAGAESPNFVDGRSFAPLLRGEIPGEWRHAVLIELLKAENLEDQGGVEAQAPIDGADKDYQTFRAIRTADRLYVEYTDSAQGLELYDTKNDQYQLQNLANEPNHADEIAAFDAYLDTLKSCKGNECRAAEDIPVGGT